ncbi:SCO family protein [Streptomyces europaeiscabiei]|uniref:SCO family protein n=1 Tax=Streptomyces europaeiscabiei TaxID=146819 RepID=A0AAJ2UQ27_9ACTN|nr:SCO family protein [Streptomyces europaeiscabiei]MDX3134579.1 SCO family protein [Streptomyces europaeiscabiei]
MHRTCALRLSATALVAAALLAGCGTSGAHHEAADKPAAISAESDSPYRGTAVDPGFAKPDLVLTGTTGKPYDLREKTAGKTTLVFFGYTNCPDVCPTTMGDISAALAQQPQSVRDNVEVVFVTTDPERDTSKSLRTWLTAFGENFTGLSGDLAKVKKAALSVGISVEDPKKHHDGTVTSDHGTQVIAFTPKDNHGRVVYTHGTTVDDFAHDLPLLVKNTR